MAINVGDVLRIADRKLAGTGVDDIGVWHIEVNGVTGSPSDATVMADIATVLDTAYTDIIGQFPTFLTFEEIDGQNVTQNTLMPSVSWPTLTAGTGASQGLPLSVAALVVFPTLTPRVQGRKYLGPIVEDAANAGILGAANITAFQTFGDNFIGSVGFGSFSGFFGTYNYTLANFSRFTSRKVINETRTMKRRYRSRGS